MTDPHPDALRLLEQRASSTKLVEPAPSGATLDRLLTAALRAPDHGALHPFRVLIIEGDGRHAFGDLLAASAKRADPGIEDAALDAHRRKALRAPMIVVVACTPRVHPKVPEIEQILTAGCVAHALVIGLQAAGFGGVWRTGGPSYDDAVKLELGLSTQDHIVGFVYVGTPSAPPPPVPRPSTRDFVSTWPKR